MSSQKKQHEERKYAHLPKECVASYAETVGLTDVKDEITSLIAQDVSYRLRESVQHAKQYMRHSKRRNLTGDDFNNALVCSDVEEVYGYHDTQPSLFVPIKDTDVYVRSDADVDLVDLATSVPSYGFPSEPKVHAEWIAVECSVEQHKAKNNDAGMVDYLSYYDLITKAILSCNESMQECALNDLRRSHKLAPVIPYFVNFIIAGVKKLNHDLVQLMKILSTVQAIIDNPNLFLGLKPFLDKLVNTLLFCILEPLVSTINPCMDHWMVRDYSARLLAQLISKWSNSVNQLKTLVENVLQEWLAESSLAVCSQYGAIHVFIYLGPNSIEYGLLPHLKSIIQNLGIMKNTGSSVEQMKSEVCKVHGALLFAAEMLLLNKCLKVSDSDEANSIPSSSHFTENLPVLKFDPEPEFSFCFPAKKSSSPSSNMSSTAYKTRLRKLLSRKIRREIPVHALYLELYEHFGDSLSTKLPFIAGYVYKSKEDNLVNLFNSPELLQTGEELLNNFYEKEEESRSNNSLDDDHSFDDNSVVSDFHDEDELCIKNTVNDPALGIKLIITKLPKSKHGSPESPKNPKSKKINLKISKDAMDCSSNENIQLVRPRVKLPNRPIHILFEGSYPVHVNDLKHRILGPEFSYVDGNQSKPNAKRLTGKMRTKRNNRQIFQSRFCSCSLSIFL